MNRASSEGAVSRGLSQCSVAQLIPSGGLFSEEDYITILGNAMNATVKLDETLASCHFRNTESESGFPLLEVETCLCGTERNKIQELAIY